MWGGGENQFLPVKVSIPSPTLYLKTCIPPFLLSIVCKNETVLFRCNRRPVSVNYAPRDVTRISVGGRGKEAWSRVSPDSMGPGSGLTPQRGVPPPKYAPVCTSRRIQGVETGKKYGFLSRRTLME